MERGTLIAGKYELGERLGRGGMGEVWAGRDRDLHRDVAVKILTGGGDDDAPELLHRFEREAVAAAQINHPNVVSLYDRGVHDGLHFLVMERIDGGTLARHVREQRPLPPPEALRIVGEICAVLVAAHRARVVHYDIKPSNVMTTDNGRVKVVDFGIAGFTHAHTFTVDDGAGNAFGGGWIVGRQRHLHQHPFLVVFGEEGEQVFVQWWGDAGAEAAGGVVVVCAGAAWRWPSGCRRGTARGR